jgi:plastocyanin
MERGGPNMTRVLRSVTVLAAAVLLAACGGNGDGGAGGGGGADEGGDGGGATALVTVDNAFQPSSLTVAAGSELEFTNDGQTIHNLSIEGQDVSEDVEAGQSTTVTIDVDPGDYTMFCEYHRSIGMEGVITVQ